MFASTSSAEDIGHKQSPTFESADGNGPARIGGTISGVCFPKRAITVLARPPSRHHGKYCGKVFPTPSNDEKNASEAASLSKTGPARPIDWRMLSR